MAGMDGGAAPRGHDKKKKKNKRMGRARGGAAQSPVGTGDLKAELPHRVEMKDLRALMVQRLQLNPKLITLIKLDRKGKYHYMVDIMDELNLANITRFSMAPMLDGDKAILQKVASL